MARDNSLPFARGLATVSKKSQTPIAPALVVGLGAAGILVVNAGISGFLDLVVPVAILWANLSYILVTCPFFLRRLRAPSSVPADKKRFSLGSWGLPISALAVIWGVLCIVNLGWPRPEIYGQEWYKQHGATLFTLGLVGAGAVYYTRFQRYKVGILGEHQPNSQLAASELGKAPEAETEASSSMSSLEAAS